MKSIFSQISKLSLFNHVMRLAMTFALCFITITAFASGGGGSAKYYSKATADIRQGTTGSGKVYVSTTEGAPAQDSQWQSTATSAIGADGSETSATDHTYYFYAKADGGSCLVGWYDAEETKSEDWFYSDVHTSEKDKTDAGITRYADFRRIIYPKGDNNEIILLLAADGLLSSGTREITLTSTKAVTTSFSPNAGDMFKVEPITGLTGATDTKDVRLSKNTESTGTIEIGERIYQLYLTPDDGDFDYSIEKYNPQPVAIDITVRPAPTVSFVPAEEGGTYTFEQNNGKGEVKEVSNETLTAGVFGISDGNTNDKVFELVANPKEGYRFRRWIITRANSAPTYDYNSTAVPAPFESDATITVEFVPNNYALFVVLGTDMTKQYAHLDDAFAVAKTLGEKVVSVYGTGGLLPQGNYTIDAGYTLLIPGDDAYTCRTGDVDISDYVSVNNAKSIRCKSHLIMDNSTTIDVKGNISVYAKMSYAQPFNGVPITYGRISMKPGCKINVKSGGVLSCLGYITGEPDESEVIAESGAIVYESFQIADWRGGGATMDLIGLDMEALAVWGLKNNFALMGTDPLNLDAPGTDQKVFPAQQYYVQSIETKLVIQYGAVERVSTAASISVANIEANADFIVPDQNSYQSGFLRLASGTECIKYYDKSADRLYVHVKGTNKSKAAIDKIEIVFKNLPIGEVLATIDKLASIAPYIKAPVHVKISSANFVLPVNNNIDIVLDDVSGTISNPVAFLAGSTFTVNANAEVNVNNQVFVYDKEHNTGFFNSNNEKLSPVEYTPTHAEYKDGWTIKADSTITGTKKRDPSVYTPDDAKWLVNGLVTIAKDGLYTTAKGGKAASQQDNEFGADITSAGGGKVNFKVQGSNSTKLYQCFQENTTPNYYEIPITNARLHNDTTKNPDYHYETTTTGYYTYVQDLGRWMLPQELQIASIAPVDTFKVTLPDDVVTHEVVCTLTEGVSSSVTKDNFDVKLPADSKFKVTEKNYGKDADGIYRLRINVQYESQNKHNVGEPHIETMEVVAKSFTSSQQSTSNVALVALEDYKPKFSVAINDQPAANGATVTIDGFVNQYTEATTVVTVVEDNVSKLSATQWTSSVNPTPIFNFAFGTGAEKLSNAKLGYTLSEDISGELAITASYKDANQHIETTTVIINLNAIANKRPNTLAFANQNDTVYQGKSINEIFGNMGTGDGVLFTYDGAETHPLIASNVKVNNNYKLTANKLSDVVQPVTIHVVATQASTAEIAEGYAEMDLTIMPTAIWNWSVLYYGSTDNHNPVVPREEGMWTLVETTDADNLVTLSGNWQDGYTAEVGTPSDPTSTCEATFTFTQGEYSELFTSKIYADPRLLPYCVTTDRTFTGVTVDALTSGITYNDATDCMQLAKNACWVIEMKDMPDRLSFTPNGVNAWRVQQSATGDFRIDGEDVMPWTQSLLADQALTLSLKPTTRYVKIEYGAQSDEEGTLCGVCISKLSIKADIDTLYMPIYYKTEQLSTKTIELMHTQPTCIASITGSLGCEVLSTTPVKEDENILYYVSSIAINVPASAEEELYNLSVSQGTDVATVYVRTYKFPQELPIRTTIDEAERYYFVTTDSRYAKWNSVTKQITFQTPAEATGYITFAFNGAPSIIRFDAASQLDDSQWTITESVDGRIFNPHNPANRVSQGNTLIHNLHYTTRYVTITHSPQFSRDVVISNVVIEGYPQVIVTPETMLFDTTHVQHNLTLKAINLKQVRVVLDNDEAFALTTDVINYSINDSEKESITTTETSHNGAYAHALGVNKVGDIVLGVKWLKTNALDEGEIKIYNAENDSLMAIVPLLGAENYITKGAKTGIFTGIPNGYTYHDKLYTEYNYHEVDLNNAFDENGYALFDYLFIYGETTTTDGTKNITQPKKYPTLEGSNALTPYYIYRKALNTTGEYKGYEAVAKIDNVNVGNKVAIEGIIQQDTAHTVFIDVQDKLSVYMTGFAPYATTGYNLKQEGVWFFRGKHGAKLDVYLEDCHIFSRNKTEHGNAFNGKEGGDTYTDNYVRGSGGVLVFENVESLTELEGVDPFEVSIHTMGDNLFKSNYGCFYLLLKSMKATQISAPIHVHMASKFHEITTKTTLNFDDLWPVSVDAEGTVTATMRTNGYLGLKKQSNNAPSIDLGNALTEVNFNGGRVELQNAQVVSSNYKTTLAISYRSGEFGGDNVGIQLSTGIGTDAVGGTVNFYDGTITVEPMWVEEAYKQYYLIDTTANGDEVKKQVGTNKYGQPIYQYQTSCLRCPKNTYVYGGSLCPLRACQHVTSKGGAPTDGPNGKPLGQFVYTSAHGYEYKCSEDKDACRLVTLTNFPNNISMFGGLKEYYAQCSYNTYGVNSVTPDENGNIYLWLPDGIAGVEAETDKLMSTWKACMTEIEAGIEDITGTVGGDTPIEKNEEVKYLLYCEIDENIHTVISKKDTIDGKELYKYKAPIIVPDIAQSFFDGAKYIRREPTKVGNHAQHQVLSDTTYTITDKVYYITTATADIWKTFTAPFDVAKIWVVESYSETALQNLEKAGMPRADILKEQAKYNADFAAFFGVAMAIGTSNSFDEIFEDYRTWAIAEDGFEGERSDYHLRDRQVLVPYYGSNWRDANFYLNHNKGNWKLTESEDEFEDIEYSFAVNWEMLPDTAMDDGILLHQGETYSMMFPYCPACENSLDQRTYWDYWSGKFLIFEGVTGTQTIKGSDFFNDTIVGNVFESNPLPDEVKVTGNSTFAYMDTDRDNVFMYNPEAPFLNSEVFEPIEYSDNQTIYPTTAFLYGYIPTNAQGMPAKGVKRTGEIIYGKDNTATDVNQGGNIPTIGGGNDLFITSTAVGINIAVAEPQHVRVMSATGAIIYSGMVQTAVDVALPATGVYVITGENEVHKILH